MKNILITGGAGYIGSHTCKALKEAGYNPIVFDNLSTGNKDSVKWGKFIEGDIRDFDALDKAIKENSIDAVMHFAAKLAVGESVEQPDIYYDNNVNGTITLLEAIKSNNVKHMVFSSSCTVYGMPDNPNKPIDESLPLKPISPYGRTKKIMEDMMEDYANAFDINYAALRYFNACGCDENLETGWYNPKPLQLVPVICKAEYEGYGYKVFGNDYDTPDGTCVRDYIHVTDLADAHVKALEYIKENNDNLIVNLGTGKGTSVLEIIESVEKAIGHKTKYSMETRRAGDPSCLFADTTLAQEKLNWKAKKVVDDMTKSAWQWHKKYFG